MKKILGFIVGVLSFIAGAYLMMPFLKTFLPFIVGIVLIIIGIHLMMRRWW